MSQSSSQDLYEWAFGQLDKPSPPTNRDKLLLLGGQYILAPFAVGYGVGVKLFTLVLLDRLKHSPKRAMAMRLVMPMGLGALGVLAAEGLFLANIEALRKAGLEQIASNGSVPQEKK